MLNKNKYLSHTIRIFIGCVFIASAILKYISIDAFDVYIYEHQLFNFAITATLTRLLIATEFVLGVLLIANLCIRFTYVVTFLFLIGFTLYLCLQPLLFDVDINNCYCFGDKIMLNHIQSIIKNLVLMGLLLLVNIRFYHKRKYELAVFIVLTLSASTAFMLIDAPDYIYKKIFRTEVRINTNIYEKALHKTTKYDTFSSGYQLICLYSTKCKYCKIAAEKIDRIIKQNQLAPSHVKCIFWESSDSTEIKHFFSENKLVPLDYALFSIGEFLAITNGKMPVILFSDKGNIIRSVNYTGFSEKDITDFLRQKPAKGSVVF